MHKGLGKKAVALFEVLIVLAVGMTYVYTMAGDWFPQPLTGFQIADEEAATVTADANADIDVDTIIIVNGGDVSTIDAAIAAAISNDLGYPVFYTEHDDISGDLATALLDGGSLSGVTNVVIIGGDGGGGGDSGGAPPG